MSTTKSTVKTLPVAKPEAVKGGQRKNDRLAANHNQAVRKPVKSLPTKGVSAKKAESVKGGMIKLKKDKLATNHNLIVR